MRFLLLTLMIFSAPVQFAEAQQSRDVRSILPTTLSSVEIRDALEPSIIERATLSARMANAEVLQTIDEITAAIINGQMDLATGKLRLLDELRAIGYMPELGAAGTIKDFTSDARIDLIVRTNASIARGYGQFIQGQSPGILDAYPAQELFRLRARKKERGWPSRWEEVDGKLVDGGRMIARKDDDIWRRLGSAFPDSLGNPYPPFAFNSGMWVKDVSRTDAVELGVIDENTQVAPQDRGFNDDLQFPLAIRSAALQQALMESLGDSYQLKDGILTYK